MKKRKGRRRWSRMAQGFDFYWEGGTFWEVIEGREKEREV